MFDLLPEGKRWIDSDQPVALATVIRTWGSSPRPAGSLMAVNADGEIAGSVSGGCVEGAVVEAALGALKTGQAQRLHFGVADETAWDVGLACGGEIDVLVQPLDPVLFNLQEVLTRQDRTFATVTRVSEIGGQFGRSVLLLGREDVRLFHGETLTLNVIRKADAVLASGTAALVEDGGHEYFVNVHLPAPVLVIVGGVQIAIALTSLAKTLGYQTIVVDPRRAFGTTARFPHADQILNSWPEESLHSLSLNRSVAVAVLTHDPKLDDPALIAALASDAFYVGALGSRKTQAARRERLLGAGLTDRQVDRLHGPIGLDLGGRSPEEIAIAIMAEIVQVRAAGGK